MVILSAYVGMPWTASATSAVFHRSASGVPLTVDRVGICGKTAHHPQVFRRICMDGVAIQRQTPHGPQHFSGFEWERVVIPRILQHRPVHKHTITSTSGIGEQRTVASGQIQHVYCQYCNQDAVQ